MRGTGPYADPLPARLKVARRRLGLEQARDRPLDTSLFRPPGPAGAQLQLQL